MVYLYILINLLLLSSSHPVSILALILAQTLLICLINWSLANTSWLSFILFIIFLGGLMVLFIYITSLASNEKFELTNETLSRTMIISLIMLILISITNFSPMLASPMTFYFTTNLTLAPIFSSQALMLTSITMTYLLVTLIVAVKITNQTSGPLRSMIKK